MNPKKLTWLLLSALIVLVLVMASCGQTSTGTTNPTTVKGTTGTPTATPTTTVIPTTTATTSKTTAAGTPKYGGNITLLWNVDTLGFDDIYVMGPLCYPGLLTQEDLWEGDWAMGPAGTNQISWMYTGFESFYKFGVKGRVAETWDIGGANNDTVTLHIRKGIHFFNKPPTNGRELTADDVAYSINRCWSAPTSFLKAADPAPVSVTVTDKYTVVVKYASLTDLSNAIKELCNFMWVWPKDALQANNNDMRDWRVNVGSGPFMLTDYVKNSSLTFVRNPNYWDTDPVGPGKGNHLPYVDGVKFLIITDVSTQVAAMRTNKGDQGSFSWDMAASLKKTNPELQSVKVLAVASQAPSIIKFRMDDPSAPWANLKVRQALHMAIDYQSIVDNFYGGNATVYKFPTPPIPENVDYFVPMKDLPQNVQDLYKYQPDKAKQMLADAGYPKGFDITIVCKTSEIDLLSIYKDYWAKVGVNLIIDPKEPAVYTGIWVGRTEKQAIFEAENTNVPFHLVDVCVSQQYNQYINDAKVNAAHDKVMADFLDYPARCKTFKDITPYILEQTWMIPSPGPYIYCMWQPWLKNFHGELSVGNVERFLWTQWAWVDQDAKFAATGTR